MDNNNTEFVETLIQQTYELPFRTLLKKYRMVNGIDKDTRHELSMQYFDVITFLARKYNEPLDSIADNPVYRVIQSLKKHRRYQLVKALRLIIQTIVTDQFDNYSDDPDDFEQHNERLREIERGQ